ncbi:TetR/AcrR family transcriptional regulator [Croceimicrobium sp.]|uniref:TetR/AcrR family transcriptional regulator n=1 Tax=Croceimicrobium sp. TaxID=2828340 RepID=UPI003BACC5F5
MTEKQEQILKTALQLFAEKGYDGTSTAKVAKEAGVSEGLIFRHFKNKEGLLQAVLEQGHEKVNQLYAQFSQEENPRKRLQSILDFAFTVAPEDHDFWRLIYALKWQTDAYDDSTAAPLKAMLKSIFEEMHYQDAEAEAELIMILLDGLVTAILLRKPKELNQVQSLLHRRYLL